MKEKKPTKITVEYEDGAKKELTNGVVVRLIEDTMEMDLVAFKESDLVRLTYGLLCSLHQKGLIDDLQILLNGGNNGEK